MKNKDLFTDETDKSLLAAFAWWEKRRIPYNIIVGLAGLSCILYFQIPIGFSAIIAIIFYGAAANLLYCSGFLLEVFVRHYINKQADFSGVRVPLFAIGLILSVVITFTGEIILGLI